ncbi:unnamed protein product [Trichobilharzia szidati]|nr:unnamed protein product [Trichobilharzia szidati]
MEPLLFRSENMNTIKPTLTRHPVNETESILECKCLPASDLKLYSTYVSYKSPTQTTPAFRCSCQENHLTNSPVQQQHQYEHGSLKYSIVPTDILTMSLPMK